MITEQTEEELRRSFSRAAAEFDDPGRARQRVLQRQYHPGRASRRLAAGGAAVAVVVAAVTVAVSGAVAPAGPGAGHQRAGHQRAVRLSAAQQILLTAAAVAARAPARTGAYWYDRQTWSGPGYHETVELWTRPSGNPLWARGKQKTHGRVVRVPGGRPGYSLADYINLFSPPRQVLLKREPRLKPAQAFQGRPTLVSFGQLQKLPTNATALTAWLTAYTRKYARQTGGLYLPRQADFLSLTSLIAEVPAPPGVRAAAFRAMAMLPGVTSLGPLSGGQGLRLPLGWKQYATVVVNTATSQVRDILTISGAGGQANSVSDTAHWVSRLP
jgi:hypothetical protein